MLRQNRHARAVAQPNVAAAPRLFLSIGIGFTSSRPPVAPSPATLHRAIRLLRWGTELVRSGLIDDPCFIAALADFEAVTLRYLDGLP